MRRRRRLGLTCLDRRGEIDGSRDVLHLTGSTEAAVVVIFCPSMSPFSIKLAELLHQVRPRVADDRENPRGRRWRLLCPPVWRELRPANAAFVALVCFRESSNAWRMQA